MRAIVTFALLFTGCTTETALETQGQSGTDGADGAPGLACWDLDGDGQGSAAEDLDGDGAWTAADCQGADGLDGEDGLDGAEGAPGLACWDLDGDGVGDPDEDRSGDGAWDATDCQGPAGADGGSMTKASVYAVTGTSGGSSAAACADADDVLLHGGCAFAESCIPAHFTGIPRNTDDPSTPAEWYCQLNCGSVVAYATCLAVP